MALRQIKKVGGQALRMGSKKGECARMGGYLIGLRRGIGKNKSTQWEFQGEDGGKILVWGSAQIDLNLGCEFDPKKESQATKMDPEFAGCWTVLTFEGTQKIKGRKQPMRNVKVEVDDEKRLTPGKPAKTGKVYTLKSQK